VPVALRRRFHERRSRHRGRARSRPQAAHDHQADRSRLAAPQLAWSRVSTVDSAELRFYRPNPQNGSIQHYYTILLEGGYVASVSTHSPDVLDPATANRPATEEVTFVFQTITWTYEPTGATAQDTWGAR